MRSQDFFPAYLDKFVKSMGIYPVGSFVRLSTGEYAVVSGANPNAPLFPTVLVVFDAKMRPRQADERVLGRPPQDGSAPTKIEECLNPKDYKIDPARYLL
jgi:hypothetical protein